MAAIPYMPLYVADYLADAAHLSTLQHGAYMLLIMTYWQRGEPLPDQDNRLARIARMSGKEWQDNRADLAEFFDVEGGVWVHGRIERELEKVRGKSEKARAAGLASAERRGSGRSTGVGAQGSLLLHDTDTDSDSTEPNGSEPLTPWVPPEPQWSQWVEHRQQMRKPLTANAETQARKKLGAWAAEDRDVAAILEYNIGQGWQGLFLPREDSAARGGGRRSGWSGNGGE